MNSLFFVAILFEHWIKQSIHAFWLIQAKHILFVFFLHRVSLIFTSFERVVVWTCFADVERHFKILDSLYMFSGISIGNSVEVFNWWKVLHQVLFLLIQVRILVGKGSILKSAHNTWHAALVTEMSTFWSHVEIQRWCQRLLLDILIHTAILIDFICLRERLEEKHLLSMHIFKGTSWVDWYNSNIDGFSFVLHAKHLSISACSSSLDALFIREHDWIMLWLWSNILFSISSLLLTKI